MPDPWTPAELARIVEAACRYIEERKRAHAQALGWEVGEYLFLNLLQGDAARLSLNDRRRTDSLGDISKRTGVPARTLRLWMAAAIARRMLASEGVHVDLGLTHHELLYRLRDHRAAACALARIADEMRLGQRDLADVATRWRRTLDAGGRLEDLLAEEPVVPRKRRRRGGGGKSKPTSHDLLRVPRLLGVVARQIRDVPFGLAQADEIRETLESIGERLAAALGRARARRAS